MQVHAKWHPYFITLAYRNYDPILGRMNGVDPMASKYSSLTPYNYSFNDPVTFNDPNGADPYDHYSGGSGYYFSGGYYTYDDVARNPDMGEFHSAFGWRDSYSMGFLASSTGYGSSMFGMGVGWKPGDNSLFNQRFDGTGLEMIWNPWAGSEVSQGVYSGGWVNNSPGLEGKIRAYGYNVKIRGGYQQQQTLTQTGTRTYLIGGADLFSDGMSNTTKTIANAVDGTAYNVNWANVRSLADKITSDIKANYVSGQRVNIYGYSEGGNVALKVVRLLENANIPVSILFTVDAADGFDSYNPIVNRSIGANVLVNYNFYQTDPSTTVLRSHGGPNTGPGTIYNVNLTGVVTHGNVDEFMMNLAIMILGR